MSPSILLLSSVIILRQPLLQGCERSWQWRYGLSHCTRCLMIAAGLSMEAWNVYCFLFVVCCCCCWWWWWWWWLFFCCAGWCCCYLLQLVVIATACDCSIVCVLHATTFGLVTSAVCSRVELCIYTLLNK